MSHPPLTSSEQTRILYLQPGGWSDDLEARIEVVSLGDDIRYTALSYAWDDHIMPADDDADVKDRILCNGHNLRISTSLGRALQYLRDREGLRLLWIDKICINQDDLQEREQHVRCMGRIFGRSESVAIWLGDSDYNTGTVFRLLHHARLYLPLQPSRTHSLAFRSMTVDRSAGCGPRSEPLRVAPVPPELSRIPAARDPFWKHVRAFLERPWLSRVWTLQEVAVTGNCYVICGKYTMQWPDFHSAATGLLMGGYSDHVLGHGIHAIIHRNAEQQKYLSGQRSSLRSLLGMARSLESTRAHDKVFALLPLVSEVTSARIPLMYDRSLVELYADAARACIAEDRHLAVLAEIELRDPLSSMPSWAPDWREKSPARIMLNAFSADQPLQTYRAAGNSEPYVLSSVSNDQLRLRGRMIAPVRNILNVHKRLNLSDENISESGRDLSALRWTPAIWNGIYRNAVTRYRTPVTVARHFEHADALSLPVVNNQDLRQSLEPADMLALALRRTLTADLYPRRNGRLSDLSVSQHFPAYAAWRDRNFEGSPPSDVLYEHDLRLKHTMINRVAFIAGEKHNAYLGIGLRAVQPGDWICVLDGGDTPFLLRPRFAGGETSAAECRMWSLISECYVHGLMDGEAMDPANDFLQRDFVLGPSGSEDVPVAKL